MEFENSTEPKLPAGSMPVENGKIESFDSAVNAAKKDLETETTAQVKGKPGRKKGQFGPKRMAEIKAEAEAAATASPTPDLGPQQVEAIPEMDFKPILKQGLQTPFRIWAKKLKNPALEVTEAELEAPCMYANIMLNYYAPRLETLDPGKTALVMFCLSMVMLVSEKTALIENTEIPTPQAQTTPQQAPQAAQTTDAKPIQMAPTMPENGRMYHTSRA